MKKKKSPLKIFLIILLILLLLLGAGAASIYYSVKAKLDQEVTHLDNIQEILAEEPANYAERVTYSEDGRVTFTVFKNDIWWMITRAYFGDPDAELRSSLAAWGLDYTGIGFSFNEDGAVVDFEAHKASIRIPLHIYVDLSVEDGVIKAKPEHIEILDQSYTMEELAEKFHVDLEDYELSYEPECSWITKIEEITIGDNCISFTGPLETGTVSCIDLEEERLVFMGLSQGDYSLISNVINDYDPDPAVCYASILPELVKDPEYYFTYLEQLYIFLNANQIEAQVNTDLNYEFAQRWYWYPDPAEYSGKSSDIYDEYYVNYRFVHSILDDLDQAYKKKKVKIGEEFDPQKLYGDQYEYYNRAVPLEGAALCTVDEEGALGCGLLVRGKDGNPYLLYTSKGKQSKEYRIIRLDEEGYQELLNQ